jgi:hypothetical protein
LIIAKTLKRRVLTVAALSGPALFVGVTMVEGLPPLSRLDTALMICSAVSAAWVIMAFIAMWMVENPRARMHNSEGIQRLGMLALLCGPAWFAYVFFGSYSFRFEELFSLVPTSFAISVGAWLLCNVAGWVFEGFLRDSKRS